MLRWVNVPVFECFVGIHSFRKRASYYACRQRARLESGSELFHVMAFHVAVSKAYVLLLELLVSSSRF